jgi:exodeoxyribonuclease-3
MSPTSPADDRLRVATWNVNSLRVRLPAVERFLDRAQPDVLCLQETRADALTAAAQEAFDRRGYEVGFAGAGSSNGVAIAARWPLREVTGSGHFGVEPLDREARLVTCVIEAPVAMRVGSVYVPHGREVGHWHYDYKLAFLDALAVLTQRWLATGDALILGGDLNVAPTDSDVFHPDAFVGSTHVSPPERTAVGRLLETGLVDVDAAVWGPGDRRFTWWRYGIGYSRNLGMRIDFLAADHRTAASADTTWVDHTERGGDRPSDHAALLADFRLGVASSGTSSGSD